MLLRAAYAKRLRGFSTQPTDVPTPAKLLRVGDAYLRKVDVLLVARFSTVHPFLRWGGFASGTFPFSLLFGAHQNRLFCAVLSFPAGFKLRCHTLACSCSI